MKINKRDVLTTMQHAYAQQTIATNLKAPAFAKRDNRTTRGKNPWNPSVTATVRVGNPLPVPATCPCCGSSRIECAHHEAVYGREYSDWPWMLRCLSCTATVGLHPFTNIPLGTLANKAIRDARMRAKDAFNPIWKTGFMTRGEAYAWLAKQLGIERAEDCHIGWFNEEQCNAVVQACESLGLTV